MPTNNKMATKEDLKEFYQRIYPYLGGAGGGGGTSNYNGLENKPQINSVILSGNKSSSDLKLEGEFRYPQLPEAGASYLNKIVQYIGTTTQYLKSGYFYKCVYDDGVYSWKESLTQSRGKVEDLDDVEITSIADGEILVWDAVQEKWINGTIPNEVQFSIMPTASQDWEGRIVQFTGQTPYTNGYFYKCVNNNGNYEWIEWAVMRVSGNTPAVVDVSGASLDRVFRTATIRWTDPPDSTISGQTIAEWGGTKLVRKIGSAPQNEEDGTLMVNSTVRDQYATDGFVDNTLQYGNTYYYRLFPYTTINVVTKGTALSTYCTRVVVPLPSQTGTLYFNNQVQTPTLTSDVGVTRGGQTSGKNAGDYNMTLALVSNDYVWADGTYEDKSITWSIQKAQDTITPSPSSHIIGRHAPTKNTYFADLYDRTITSVVSTDSTVATATTDGQVVTVSLASNNALGDCTINVTTNSTSNCNSATASITVHAIDQIIYGINIDGNESDPSTMVSYIEDNENFTPAYMDYTSGVFNYGSWSNAFFLPRPCMLKYDGTVDYYLSVNNYAKRADGVTDSDIGDSSYQGNAMMEWGQGSKIWYNVDPYNSGKSARIRIANYQVNANYHDWSFHNSHGVSVDHFYTPIYNGSLVDGKLRSLSGRQVSKSLTGTQEIAYAKANNPSGSDEMWNIECLADRMLINFLLILMGKSCDTQTVFGKGACEGGSESVNDTFRTGQHNAKGLFYGTNSGSVSSYTFDNVVKVFGMENYYGFQWRRTNGCMYVSNEYKVKMTYGQEDGSTVDGYNENGSGYVAQGFGCGGTNGGYINEMKYTDYGQFGKNCSGSDSTYYTDAEWFANGTMFAFFGGYSDSGAWVGALYAAVSVPVSDRYWGNGAALSLKPLVEEG